MYIPKPIETKNITLPDEMASLVEHLARNTHDVWAQKRIIQGWKYGKERNDKTKTHPCLVEYDNLSDNEKEYDIVISQEVLKTIMKLGYRIVNTSSENEEVRRENETDTESQKCKSCD